MMENERKAEIKSYYSQELLDGVKDIDLRKLADDVWNIMNHIPIKTKQESMGESEE